MVKLLENTFRTVNIGLVNEIALMCDRLGIDVWEVIDAAATKPFGFMPFYPGPGLGGHCIPIDPFYLSWKAKQTGFDPRFIELAGQINGAMPHFVVDKIADALNRHRSRSTARPCSILGVAYKRDIDDMRESPSLDVMALLHEKGANVRYADPLRADAAGACVAGRLRHGDRASDAGRARRGGLRGDSHRAPRGRLRHGAQIVAAHRRHAQRDRRQHEHVFKLGAPAPAMPARDREVRVGREGDGVLSDMALVFWISVALIAYVYVGYPAMLCGRSRMRSRTVHESTIQSAIESAIRNPQYAVGVSIVIAARNEGSRLAARLDNLLSLSFPAVAAPDHRRLRRIER